MAVGKQKLKAKKIKKKTVDTYAKKEWYSIKAPSMFAVKDCGRTLINRTQGTKIAADGLRGRVFEVNLADLNNDPERGYRKIKLICEDIRGLECLTNFHGMDMTRDKLCSLMRKWQTTIDAHVDVRTTDGVFLRIFVIAFTRKQEGQQKKTCYAQSSQIRAIRAKMRRILSKEASKSELKDLVKKFNTEHLGEKIQRACEGTFPLTNCFIRKVKVLKKPKFDVVKLMELHGTKEEEDKGAQVPRPEEEKPAETSTGVETLKGSGGRL